MMKYFRIDWIHEYPDDPIRLYSEVGQDGYETRRVDIYRDGRAVCISEQTQDDDNLLSDQVYPSLQELNSKDEWDETRAQEIARKEFETIWNSGP